MTLLTVIKLPHFWKKLETENELYHYNFVGMNRLISNLYDFILKYDENKVKVGKGRGAREGGYRSKGRG